MLFYLYMCCNVRLRSDNTPVELKEPLKGKGQGQRCKKKAFSYQYLVIFPRFGCETVLILDFKACNIMYMYIKIWH